MAWSSNTSNYQEQFGGAIWGGGLAQQLAYNQLAQMQNYNSLIEVQNPNAEPPKLSLRFIDKLRAEIKKWHGDILN